MLTCRNKDIVEKVAHGARHRMEQKSPGKCENGFLKDLLFL